MKRVLFSAFFFYSSALHAQSVEEVLPKFHALIAGLTLLFLIFYIGVPQYALYRARGWVGDRKRRYSRPTRVLPVRLPDYVKGKKVHILRQGHDIILSGAPRNKLIDRTVRHYAIQPTNFRGIFPIPKLTVQVGDRVKAGDVLYYQRYQPKIQHVAPVSGEITAINRGRKRSIIEVVIAADEQTEYKPLQPPDWKNSSREELVEFLLQCGAWPLFNQRPYDIIPPIDAVPRDIFISTFSTAPLAPDYDMIVNGHGEAFQMGLNVLTRLTSGKVHLGLNANGIYPPASEYTEATGVEKHWFYGVHPTGNVGVQIHHIAPIRPGDVVWTLTVQQVIQLGKIWTEQKWVADRVIAIAGAGAEETGYVRTKVGANIGELIGEPREKTRYISGDVLSGEAKALHQFLNWQHEMVSCIPEGDYFEPFGWLIPSRVAPSRSRTLANFVFPNKVFDGDTNTHGEKRAFVMSDDYDGLLPMDIPLYHLMKAILVNDYDKMEQLGIKELSEEDVALAEWRCTSKQPLQQILRRGLEMWREQEM